jgi:hypothetical protein
MPGLFRSISRFLSSIGSRSAISRHLSPERRSVIKSPRHLAAAAPWLGRADLAPICGTARVARAFFNRFTHWDGAVICPAFARGTWPLASMISRNEEPNQVYALERIGGSGFTRLGISSHGFIACCCTLPSAGLRRSDHFGGHCIHQTATAVITSGSGRR